MRPGVVNLVAETVPVLLAQAALQAAVAGSGGGCDLADAAKAPISPIILGLGGREPTVRRRLTGCHRSGEREGVHVHENVLVPADVADILRGPDQRGKDLALHAQAVLRHCRVGVIRVYSAWTL